MRSTGTAYKKHETRIIEHAVDTIFPLPDDPDQTHLEGVLAGYAAALAAIGSRITRPTSA